MIPFNEIKRELFKFQEYSQQLQKLLLEIDDKVPQVVVQVLNTDLQRLIEKLPTEIPEDLYHKHFVNLDNARKEDSLSLGDK